MENGDLPFQPPWMMYILNNMEEMMKSPCFDAFYTEGDGAEEEMEVELPSGFLAGKKWRWN